MTPNRPSLLFLARKKVPALYSMERVFGWIGAAVAAEFAVSHAEVPCVSRGLLRRLRNMLWASGRSEDLVHVTGDVNYVTMAFRGRAVVQTLHDIGTWHRLGGVRRLIFEKLWIVWPIRASRVTTVVSEFTKAELARIPGVDVAKVAVVPNPVDPGFQFRPKAWNATRPRLLVVGTAANKNLERIAEALAGLPCEVTVIGPLSAEQSAHFTRNAVAFAQKADLSPGELQEEYVGTDALLFPSTYEGFGLPIVEAQTVGRPVITSSVASMPEIAGDGAVLVDPFDVSSIRRGVVAVMNDEALRGRLIAAGRTNAERFSLDRIARAYAALYRSALSPDQR